MTGSASRADRPSPPGPPVPDARARFLDALAHDLRTPLAAIIGYQELLVDNVYGDAPAALHDPLRRIGDAARQLEQLLDAAIEFAEPLAQPPAVPAAEGDVATLIHDQIDALRSLAHTHHAELAFERPEHAVPLRVDPAGLAAAIHLAVGAAVRAPPHGRLTLRLTDAADTVDIHIGPTTLPPDIPVPDGIDDFAPADPRDAPRSGSLRLAFARRLARRLGGHLTLVPGSAGTALRLTFPRAARDAQR
ncbi:MAG: sensor histidine kinase [Longimicrobiales bacterium]